jgi:hypothetical protein
MLSFSLLKYHKIKAYDGVEKVLYALSFSIKWLIASTPRLGSYTFDKNSDCPFGRRMAEPYKKEISLSLPRIKVGFHRRPACSLFTKLTELPEVEKEWV